MAGGMVSVKRAAMLRRSGLPCGYVMVAKVGSLGF
jgi:hypothetical protein